MDELDKAIIQCLSMGARSYQEMAENCNVTRNTVYRRIADLEKKGIIRVTTGCIINFSQLGVMPVIAACKVAQKTWII
jgi:DNA-binding Lrp family transcriptional regulator